MAVTRLLDGDEVGDFIIIIVIIFIITIIIIVNIVINPFAFLS